MGAHPLQRGNRQVNVPNVEGSNTQSQSNCNHPGLRSRDSVVQQLCNRADKINACKASVGLVSRLNYSEQPGKVVNQSVSHLSVDKGFTAKPVGDVTPTQMDGTKNVL